MNIEDDLFKMQDKKYREFQSKLCPGINNIIGIKLPNLRKYAKKISGTVSEVQIPTNYYEEIMLKGMLIGLEKELNYEKIKNFIHLINNWAVCDTFCTSLKNVKKDKEKMWAFLKKYLSSTKEFEVRFAVVMMLQYYIDENYIDNVLMLLEKIKHEGYYAQMAVAWAYSICFVKFYNKTKKHFLKLKKGNTDKNKIFIINKSIQKATESYRLTKEQKCELREIKIK